MAINVPQSVFDKYFEVIDSTFDIFGVTCQLVSIEKKEKIVYNPDNNLPDVNTINDHRRGGGDRDRGTVTIVETEVLTDIKLKVYWDKKQWTGITDAIQIPDGSIQTISYMTDLPKINKANYLIPHYDGIEKYDEMRFQKSGSSYPQGFKQNETRYVVTFWSRMNG